MQDKGNIYAMFRALIQIELLSAASASAVKNPQGREKVLASFGSVKRTRKLDDDLRALEILEEDDDMEIVSWGGY